MVAQNSPTAATSRRIGRPVLVVAAALAAYFVASIALTIFNKWLFTEPKKAHATASLGVVTSSLAPARKAPSLPHFASPYAFHFPLTVTCVHQALVFGLVLLANSVPALRRRLGEVERSHAAFWTFVPIGAICGIDWGLSNTSLRSIPLSLYEMVKSASPVVVLLLSFRLGMARPTAPLVLVVALISVGMFLSVSGGDVSIFFRDDFPTQGFAFVLTATLLSGTRVVLAQYALQRGDVQSLALQGVRRQGRSEDGDACPAAGAHGPFNTMTALFYAAPASTLALTLPALVFEVPDVAEWARHHSGQSMAEVAALVLVTSVVAFGLSLLEFVVTSVTSALTLCVVGISKQILIVGIAIALLGEPIHAVNASGFVMSIIGIFLYRYVRAGPQGPAGEDGFGPLPTSDGDRDVVVEMEGDGAGRHPKKGLSQRNAPL